MLFILVSTEDIIHGYIFWRQLHRVLIKCFKSHKVILPTLVWCLFKASFL